MSKVERDAKNDVADVAPPLCRGSVAEADGVAPPLCGYLNELVVLWGLGAGTILGAGATLGWLGWKV
jgi:hypothetical protein